MAKIKYNNPKLSFSLKMQKKITEIYTELQMKQGIYLKSVEDL